MRPRQHNKAVTHLCIHPILPSRRREADPVRLEAHKKGQRCHGYLVRVSSSPVPQTRKQNEKRTRRPFSDRHTRVTRSHAHLGLVANLPRIVCLLLIMEPLPSQAFGFGFDITLSALSNPSTSTNPSTRPRTCVITQAAALPVPALPHFLSRLAVQTTAASSMPIVGRLPTPSSAAPPSSGRTPMFLLRRASILGGR